MDPNEPFNPTRIVRPCLPISSLIYNPPIHGVCLNCGGYGWIVAPPGDIPDRLPCHSCQCRGYINRNQYELPEQMPRSFRLGRRQASDPRQSRKRPQIEPRDVSSGEGTSTDPYPVPLALNVQSQVNTSEAEAPTVAILALLEKEIDNIVEIPK